VVRRLVGAIHHRVFIMANRYKKITDPDGNHIDTFSTREQAFLEKLDGRNPLYKHYKYRFTVSGKELPSKFLNWMVNNFGPPTSYGMAKHYVKCGQGLENVPWVHYNERSYWNQHHIYFNQDCEVLVRLNFMGGQTL